MQDVRPVVVDAVRVVELHVPVAHVHRVRREPAPGEHDGRVGRRDVARRARVRRRGDGQVEVRPTVAERRRDARRKAGRVKDLGGVGRRIGPTLMLGFDPAINTDASGNRSATEWYILAMLVDPSPALDQREHLGALGL